MKQGTREMKLDLDTLEKIERELLTVGGTKQLGELYSVSCSTVSKWHSRLKSIERVRLRNANSNSR